MREKMRKKFCTKHFKQERGIMDLRSLPHRSGLQCMHGKSLMRRSCECDFKLRGIQHKPFSEAEEDLFFKLHALLGNRWALIAGRLPERTETEVKNYWNSYLKTKRSKNYTKKQMKKQRRLSPSLTLTLDQTDQVSDAASQLDGDDSMTRDVNLDLSISMSSSPLLDVKKVQQNTCNKTLLLFP